MFQKKKRERIERERKSECFNNELNHKIVEENGKKKKDRERRNI